jgi:nucleoside-triphosphatase THEP1
MIYILTGPTNSGKTTWLLRDFSEHPEADGFSCQKVFSEGVHIGYDLYHLSTGLSCPFIRIPQHIPPHWEETATLDGRFSFSSAGFLFARHITQNAILNNVNRFYFDEAGHLELRGLGLSNLLTALIGSETDLILVVRDTLVNRIVDTYKINSYQIITPEF